MKKQLGLLLLVFLVPGAALSQTARPNILMIAVDDLNDWVGVYGGHPQCQTPHMDKLAQTSMVFHNASCPGPVCGSSRSALLSGFMPASTGIYGNSNNMLDSSIVQTHATLPEYFSKHGYRTISKGKIFHKHTTKHGVDQGQWAFDVWEEARGRGAAQPDKFFSRNQGIVAGRRLEAAKFKGPGTPFEFGPTRVDKSATKDYQTAKWFEQQLQRDYDQPFFMAVGISKPHLPFVVPQEYFDRYDRDTVKVPEFRIDDLDDIVNGKGKKKFDAHLDFLWCQEYGTFQDAVQAYMAAVTYADDCVGVVLDALAKSQHADNTIVILWGDHGWHLGEKLKFRKAALWRESTQLPLMIHLPGMIDRADCRRNVNLIDLYPTLIDLCGLPAKELDGKSICPLLNDPTREWAPTVTTGGKGNHSVISEEWHYIVYRDGTEELYDLREDPMEWTNLANGQSAEIASVKSRLRSFLPSREADEIPRNEKNKQLKILDETIQARRSRASLK